MTGKRALVTGLAGFTGHYVARELEAAGWEVFGLGSNPSELPRYSVVELSDQGGLRRVIAEVRPHALLHLAAVAFVGHGDAEAFYRVNLIGTRNLLEAIAAEAPDVECVLLASSANIYGNATEGVLTEQAPASPANDYAVSKLAMEYMAHLWQGRLPLVITRPFNYTGVGQTESFLIPKIVGHFRRRAAQIELGNLDVFRDFSDVRAVAAAYRKLIETRPAGGVFNVCSGRTSSLREVIQQVAALAGYEIEINVNPAFVRANEVKTLCGSADALKAAIGEWDTPPLAETLAWMYGAPN